MGRTITSFFFVFGLFHTILSQDVEYRYCGNTPADVVFMLDSSNSIWGPNFREQLNFVTNVVSMFDIGHNATRVGLATFNNNVQLQFNLNGYYEKDAMIDAIQDVRQTFGDITATDVALEYLRRRMFSAKSGGREGVAHVAIVVTDGRSESMLRTLIQASRAKRRNIHLFTIGVGKSVNDLELNRMASWPPNEYSFLVSGFPFLFSIQNKLAIRTCQVTKPPTTTVTTTTTTTTTTPAPTTTASTTTPTPTTTTTTPTTTTTTTTPTTTTTTTTTTTPTTTTPTTTIPTTTTTAGPTTTTWVDVVRKECRHRAVDIVFAMDSSNVIEYDDFWYQLRFVRDFTLGLDIGENKTRIGVVLYSDKVVHGFDVNDHASLLSAINDLYKLERSEGGETRLDEVIRYVRTRSFRRTVSRRNSAQIAVLITGSSTKKLHRVKKEAIKARTTGVNIITVGVGKNVNPVELEIIASANDRSPNDIMSVFEKTPEEAVTRRFIYRVKTFERLGEITQEASIEACNYPPTAVPVSDQACGTRQEADMMFVMDSASAGRKNTKEAMSFMKKVTQKVEVDKKSVQIGMLQPDDCLPPSQSFKLNSHKDKTDLIQDLESPSKDEFVRLLKKLRKSAFKKKKGGRKQAKKIAIILVDGDLADPLKALDETVKAKLSGVEVYVIVVGNNKPQPEISEMCNYPPRDHLFTVPNYAKLRDLEDSLIELLCDEL